VTRRKKLLTIAGVAAFGFGFLSSLRSAPAQERFDMKVRDDFFAGFAGNQEALDRGMKSCESTLATNPKHAEALVWHGSGLYYLGGRAFQTGDSEKGMELVKRGISEMSRAVELEPDNIAVRIPRGAALLQSTLFMPENEFRRGLIESGLEDYLRTFELQKAHFDQLGTHPRGELLLGIADANRRLGNTEEADRWFRKIASDLEGSIYQKRADKWLETRTLETSDVQCAGCHVSND
jgi:tetratricopeptide (TPR) repeat protein